MTLANLLFIYVNIFERLVVKNLMVLGLITIEIWLLNNDIFCEMFIIVSASAYQ